MSQNKTTAYEKVMLARNPKRPGTVDFIEALFTNFFEQKGDRIGAEDHSIVGGVALYYGYPVTVIGHRKGKTLEENVKCNFGMPIPQGYRKVIRLLKAAEKFNRPVITFIDTPGAYPGMQAEENGQGTAIAQCIATMSTLKVPVISIVTGEGGSGGALALGVANQVLMLENAVYSVLSPEGFASILWKDASKAKEASEVMKLTAKDLLELNIIDKIVKEPIGGAQENVEELYRTLDLSIQKALTFACKLSSPERHRMEKYDAMGREFTTITEREVL